MHAAVEDQADRVVPAAPRRQPVGEQQAAGRDGQRELLLDLAADREPRRLADLDHAAGQVPVPLVGQLAEQHPSVGVADEHLPDRALAGEEGVEQRPEALGLAERRVAHQPGEHDVRRRLGAVAVAALDPAQALAAQPAAGGHAQRRLVVGLDLGLDPPVPQPALPRLGQRVVGQHPHRAGGVPAPAMPLEQHPRQLAHPVGRPLHVHAADQLRRRPRRRTRPPSGPSSYAVCQRSMAARCRSGVTPSTGQPNQCAITSSWPATASSTSSSRQRRSVTSPSVRVGCSGTSGTPDPNHRWSRRAEGSSRNPAGGRVSVHSPGFVTGAARPPQPAVACGTTRWRAAARPRWRTRAGRPARPRPPRPRRGCRRRSRCRPRRRC